MRRRYRAAFPDLSGTGLADEAAVIAHCSSGALRTSGGGSVGSLASFKASFDGGRQDVLRYDTPAPGPATIAASVSNNNEFEVGAYIDHSLGGGQFSLYGGYRSSDNRRGNEQWAVSASFLFSQGTSISGTYGESDPVGGAKDADNYYVKLGHKWGNNAVSVSYGETSDAVPGFDAASIGVGWVHTMSGPGVEIYAGYHNIDVDAPAGINTEDFDMFVVGSRVKFQ